MKIAIIEDEKNVAIGLKLYFECKNHETLVLVDDPDKISKRLNEIVQFAPDRISMDGLDGECFTIYEQLSKMLPKAKITIYSGGNTIGEQAREKGYACFHKLTDGDKFFEFMSQ